MAIPALVQSKTDTGESGITVTTWKVNLPQPSQAGNCIVVIVQAGLSGISLSVADDKTNTYTGTTQINDGTTNNALRIFYALNVASATQLITVTFTGGAAFNQVQVMEFTNVATTSAGDGETGRATSGTSVATAAFVTTFDGDLIIHAAVGSSWPSQTTTMTWTPGATFTMAAVDNSSYMATQYRVQTTAGSNTPSITSNINFNTVLTKAIALKSASSGSDLAAGIRVRKVAVMGLENLTNYATYSGTAFVIQMHVTGNLVALGWTGRDTPQPTSITSSPSLTWSHTTASTNSGGSINAVWWWYAVGATPDTYYTFTVNFASTPSVCMFNLFDISGANSSPFDTFLGSTGTNSTHPTPGENGVVVNGPNITPTTANGLILAVQQEDQHTIVNASPGYFNSTDIGLYSSANGDTDQGSQIYYNPSTSAVQLTWTYNGYEGGVTGVGAYASQAIAFKAAGSGDSPRNPVAGGGSLAGVQSILGSGIVAPTMVEIPSS